ncbi:hypothetical protein, partial [Legionella pneumophila]|uniref:hypothetical protein n=2 Tax=Legionella pneumophila TaxID=446 RepID=UPI001E4E9852
TSTNSGHWIASSLRSSQRRSQKSYRTELVILQSIRFIKIIPGRQVETTFIIVLLYFLFSTVIVG